MIIISSLLTLGHKPSLNTRLLFILAFSAFISACSWDQECESMPFDELNNTSYILLIEDFDWGNTKIDDPEKISAVIASIKSIPGHWADPWYAAPLGGYGALFYSADGNRINEYRITQKRAELTGCGTEQYIRINSEQGELLFSALSMNDHYRNRERTNGIMDWLIDLVEE